MKTIEYIFHVLIVSIIISAIALYFGYGELMEYIDANYIMIEKPF